MREYLARRRPSPAMAVAFIALLAALSGTAVALPGRNTVDSGDLKRGAVKSSDIGRGAVTGAKIRNGAVTGAKIRNGAVTGAKIANGTITGAKLANDTVTGEKVNEGTLGTVPRASEATTATNAGAASSVATLKPIGVSTVEEGSSTTLVQYGPFTVSGACVAVVATTEAQILITTSEEGTTAAGQNNSVTDLGPLSPPLELSDAADAAGGTPSAGDGYDDTITAFAPSGRALTGVVSPWADASAGTSGQCKFHGHIVIDG